MNSNKISVKNDAKRVFLKKGACSHTFFYLLNREFGHLRDDEERGLDPLQGGIMQMGYQCGMLWGSSLAVGAESYRRSDNQSQATAMAITATQHIMESFKNTTNAIDCVDITHTDFSSKFEMLKFMIFKAHSCFSLAKKFAPDAIQAANEGLSVEQSDLPERCMSCASEVVKKMGATDEQIIMVAGLAGGMGLSGKACGALCAAIWIKTMKWCKENNKKAGYPNPVDKKVLDVFYKETDYKILCSEITGKHFKSIDDHTEFIENDGCDKLIEVLAGA